MIARRNRQTTLAKARRAAAAHDKRRRLLHELLEERRLLAVGPQLLSIEHNSGATIQDGGVHETAPNELTFHFTEGQELDPATLDAIRLVRSGSDGIFENGNDVEINPAYLDFGQTSFTVLMRFGQTLPDDLYRIEIIGEGSGALRNMDGMAFGDATDDGIDNGQNFSTTFDLQLGAQVLSVVPQPITRDPESGELSQAKDQIQVHFNDDPLDPASAGTPAFYRLIDTHDGSLLFPQAADYDSGANMATLTFPFDLSMATYELQIGTTEESNETAETAVDLGTISQQAIHAIYDSPVREDAEGNVVPTVIPDNGSVLSAISVVDSFLISDVNVELNIDHQWGPDLRVFLQSPGGQRVELVRDLGSQVRSGQIYGTKYEDLNGNGVRDDDEPGLAGWTIFVDENGNGELDPGERSTVTDSEGRYSFVNLEPNRAYDLVSVPQTFWQPTDPSSGVATTLYETDFSSGVVQTLNITGDPTTGTFRLGFLDRVTPGIEYAGESNPGATADNLREALQPLLDPGVAVSVAAITGTQFNLTFTVNGVGTPVDHPALMVLDNQLDTGQLRISNAGDSSGFTSVGTNNLWHLSTGRGNDPGRTPEHGFYFGQGESDIGGGTYVNNADATLRSPEIDLTDPAITGTLTLRLNHFLGIEQGFDFAEIRVVANGQRTVLLRTDQSTDGFEPLEFDVSPFVDSRIRLEFHFQSDVSVVGEGWYIDDIRIEMPRAAQTVTLGTGPQEQVIKDIDFGSIQTPTVGPDAFGYRAYNVSTNFEDISGNDSAQRVLQQFTSTGFASGIGHTGDDVVHDMARDADGNIYVTGSFQGTVDFDPGDETESLTSAGGNDIFVAKYDSDGGLIWAQRAGGSSNAVATSVAVDSAGNVVVGGEFSQSAEFGGVDLTSNGSIDAFIWKLDTAGATAWAHGIGGSGVDAATGIDVAANGDVLATGYFSGTVDFDPGEGTQNRSSSGGTDIFILRLSGAGNLVWVRQMGGTGADRGESIHVTDLDMVTTTGSFSGTVDFNPGGGSANLTSAGSADGFVQQLTPQGTFRWAQRFGTAATSDRGNDVTSSASGDVFVTGVSGDDIFVRRIAPTGTTQWTRSFGGNATDIGESIDLAADGTIAIAGSFRGTADLGDGERVSSGGSDAFVLSLNPSGDFVTASAFGGNLDDSVTAVLRDGEGSLLAAGTFRSTVTIDVGTSTETLENAGSRDIFLARIATAVGVDDDTVELTASDLDGFDFEFYGELYDSLFVSTNGLITFGEGNASSANTDLLELPEEAAIAAFWEDLRTGSADVEAVFWEVLGTENNQRLIVQWNNVRVDNPNADGIGLLDFQAVLHRVDGAIQLNYRSVAEPQVIAEGPEQSIGMFTKGQQTESSIAADEDGNHVIVWTSPNQDGSSTEVYARRFDAAGDPLGDEFRINETVSGPQGLPHIAMNEAGRFVVVWQGNGPGDSSGVFGRVYDSDGSPVTGEFRVHQETAGQQANPQVGVDADGSFVVVWDGVGEEDSNGVYARRFASNGQPLGVVDEIQQLRFLGPPASGSTFTLIHAGAETAPIRYFNNPDATADSIRDALRALPNTGNDLEVVALEDIDEVQTLTFTGDPTGGDVVLDFGASTTAAIEFAGESNGEQTAENIKTALEALPEIDEVTVVQVDGSDVEFTVTFSGPLVSGVDQPLLEVNENNLEPDEADLEIEETVPVQQRAGLDFEVHFLGNDGNTDQPQLIHGLTQDGVTHIESTTLREGSNGQLRVNNFMSGAQSRASIDVVSSGEFLVAWQSQAQDGSGLGVFSKRYAADGTAIEQEFDEIQRITLEGSLNANAIFSLRLGGIGGPTTGNILYAGAGNGSQTAERIQIALRSLPNLQDVTVEPTEGTSDEFQLLRFTPPQPATGTFRLAHRGLITDPIVFEGPDPDDAADTAANIEEALRALPNTDDEITVEPVVAAGNDDPFQFIVRFVGPDGGVNHPQLVFVDNQLNQGGMDISTLSEGGQADNQFIVTFAGASGRQGQPNIQLASGSAGVSSLVAEELVRGVNSEFQVNTETIRDQAFPSVVTRPDGSMFFTWSSQGQDGDGFGVFGKLLGGDGQVLREEFQINTFTENDQVQSRAGTDADGNLVVVWQSLGQDGDLNGVYGRRISHDGFPVGDEFPINSSTAGDQFDQDVTVNPDGSFIVSWSSEAVGGGIHSQRFAADASKIGDEQQISQFGFRSHDAPEIAHAENGNYVVIWEEAARDADNSTGIYGQLFDASGTALTGEFQVASNDALDQTFLSIDMDAAGNFVVAWSTQELDAEGDTIFSARARRFDSTGTPQGEEFTIDSDVGASLPVDVSLNQSTGDFVAVWQVDDESGVGIYAKVYDSDGVEQTDAVELASTTDDVIITSFHPRVAVDASGAFAVTWTSLNMATFLWDVHLGRWDAAGNPTADSRVIGSRPPSDSGFDYFRSDLADSSSGELSVVWQSFDFLGNSTFEDVLLRRFDSELTPLGDAIRVNDDSTSTDVELVPRISQASDDSFVITWQDMERAGGLLAQRFGPTGLPIGDNFLVTNVSSDVQSLPVVMAEEGGEFRVAYLDDREGLGVFTRSFASDLASVGIKAAGVQDLGENVLQVWVDGTRTSLVGANTSTRISLVEEAPGRLFAVDAANDRLLEVDFLTGMQVASFPLPEPVGGEAGLAFAGGTVYYLPGNGERLYELHPDTGGTVEAIQLSDLSSSGLAGLAFLDGEVIVLDTVAQELVFIDPFEYAEVRRITPAGLLAGGLVGGGNRGSLFAINADSEVVEIDPVTGAIQATLPSPGEDLVGLALIDGVLLASDDAGVVYRIDPDDGQVLGTLDVAEGLTALGADGGGGVASARGGDYQPMIGTLLDDEAAISITEGVGPFTGSFIPVEPLSTFDGANARGSWRLEIEDTASNDTGVLNGWRLIFNDPKDVPPDVEHVGFIGDNIDPDKDPANDVDIYRFNVLQSGMITVDVDATADLDVALRLFDSAGNPLTAADSEGIGGSERLVYEADSEGMFFVGVTSSGNMSYDIGDGSGASGGSSNGSYSMGIRFSEPIAQDDDNSSYDTSTVIGPLGVGGQRIRSEIRSAPFSMDLPGRNDEPGHRNIPPESHLIQAGGHDHSSNQMILRFKDEVSQQRRSEILSSHGLELLDTFDFIGATLVKTENGSDVIAKVRQLGQLAEVEYAEPDYIYEPQLEPNDPLFPDQWHLNNTGQTGGTPGADIDLALAWDTFTGSRETVIAVLDTGVDYTHPDLAANIWVNPGEIPGNGIDDDGNGYIDDVFGIDTGEGDSDPMDNNGHGTHVAGTIAAVGNNGVGVSGVNWNSKIMPLKVGNAAGLIPNSAVIEALNYMVTMKTVYDINIVASNNSYGGSGFSQAMMDAISETINVGIPFVAAAGNFGIDNDVDPHYPASYTLDGIISVGASDHNDEYAGFSHFGETSVDLAAPGVNVLSTTLGGGYGLNSGTSMASPHVAGVVGLLAGFNPDATVGDLKSAIMLGADPLPNMTGTTVTGARLNAAQSLSLLGAGSLGPVDSAIQTAYYNFQDIYGVLPSGADAINAITEIQKQRAREIFEIYAHHLGIEFVETADEGLTVVTGDLRVIDPSVPSGPGGVLGISEGTLSGRVVMDAAENWGDSEYSGEWFVTAMHEIGHSLGLGHTYDLPNLTVMGGFGVGEPVFPGDHDLVHAKHLHKPASIDQDLYRFALPEDGTLTVETIAERLEPNASLLDTVISVYREVGSGRRELIARNDDYYSNDSFLQIQLTRGTYYVGVSAAGNKDMDPAISDSGFGGTSEGDYELVLDFEPSVSASIIDATGVSLDGNSDGSPGGTFSYFFQSGPTLFVDKLAAPDGDGSLESPIDNIHTATQRAKTTLVMPRGGSNELVDGDYFSISDGLNATVRFEFDANESVAAGSVAIPFDAGMSREELAARVAMVVSDTASSAPLNVSPIVDQGQIRMRGATALDASGASGLLRAPHLIRIVGNGGADGDLATLSDNQPYLLGLDGDQVLEDGASLEVPQGVTVMLEAGALFKLREANVDVGTSAEGVDRRHGALQVLGTPEHQVSFYSYHNDSVGGDSDGPGLTASPGDWGGLVFRGDSDMEEQGLFLNWVNNATIVSGGGKLLVDSVEETFTPIHLIDSRPTISNNLILRSADAAVSADPASFRDDDGRVGPDIHNNLIIDNSINGLFVRIRTELGEIIDKIVHPSRWDNPDIVHVLTENLLIDAQPGGPIKDPVSGVIQARMDGNLKIDPGVIVKLQGARIEAAIGGQLIAEGTSANPIIFTSLSNDAYGSAGSFDTKNDGDSTQPAPGQWGGLVFNNTSKANLDHVAISFGGGLTPIEGGFDRFNVIESHQADVRLANSIVTDNAAGTSSSDRNGRGANAPATFFVRGAQPIIVNNLFMDNEGSVIHINANAMQAVRRPDTGRVTGHLDSFDQFADNSGPLVRLNRLQNNSINGMEIRGAVLTTESVWDDTNIAHVLREEIEILNHHTFSGLHLVSNQNESLVVKLAGENAGFTTHGTLLDIDDRIGGSLYIDDSGRPVILTSLADDTAAVGADLLGQPLGDTNNDGPSSGSPGDWRSILLNSLSNDRNVALIHETEPAFSGLVDSNRVPSDAQFLGNLAPDEKSGDVNRRLGFEVHGNISVDNRRDIDVYSFSGVAGTEVFFDIDQTSSSLDGVLELIDANGTVLARSLDSSIDNLSGLALPLLKASHLGPDFYSISERDPGMRVILPGTPGDTNTYFVRFRSRPAEGDIENLDGGLSRGEYKLQIRLRQVDEKPGVSIRGADIRFATNGIEVIGLPAHSPLIGETVETRANNDTLGAAQPLGNLLTTDRNALSVAGNLSSPSDVDWYQFELDYDLIQSIGGFDTGMKTFAAIFDIDYADGIARPDTVMSIFDADGNLVLLGRSSNIEDDQPRPGQGLDSADLSRGSFGTLDPFVGSVQMPAGVPGTTTTYYVAISSNAQLPTALNANISGGDANAMVRLEPVTSVTRIAEDHIGFQGYRSGNADAASQVQPTTPLFDISNSISLSTNVVPFTLNDVTLYTAQPGNNGLKTINPFTGTQWTNVGDLPTANPGRAVGDLAMRSDGRLFMVEGLAGAEDTAGRLVEIDPGTGATTVIGNDNIPDIDPDQDPPDPQQLTSSGIDAFAWLRTGVAQYDLYYAVRGGRLGPSVNANSSTLYRANPDDGSAAVADGQPWGLRGEIYQNTQGDLGRTTGMAFVDGTLFGVSDQGFFYQISLANGRASNVVSLPFQFSGLAIGPQNVESGTFANLMFASTSSGQLIALNTSGSPQPVFSGGSTSVNTGTSAVGLAFSVLDFNLWHPTMRRGSEPGHGVNDAFDNSRDPGSAELSIGSNTDLRTTNQGEGGASFYFGLETWQDDPSAANAYFTYGPNAQYGILESTHHQDMSANPIIGNNYDMPGGALGSLATNPISLAGYAAADKPTMYFNYFLETENQNSVGSNGMRDSARVLVSADGGNSWDLIATNNSILSTAGQTAELPRFISPNVEASTHSRQQVQELFDNTGVWRQARVDLSNYAGAQQLQFRFDFSTAGAMIGPNGAQPGDPSVFGNLNDNRRAQDNDSEGFYIDDVIIGFAERGEMVTNAGSQSTFFTIPQNPDPSAPSQILVGQYQLEMRRGTEYAETISNLGSDVVVFQTLDTNARLVGELFRLGDRNLHRDQGQVLIADNTISDTLDYGIVADAAVRDVDGNLPRPGGVINTPTINNARLTAGVKIENNIVAGFGQGGIRLSGDPNAGSQPLASVPFGRIMNNTVFGGDTPTGTGIEITENASPTILNNVIANTVTGLVIDGSSSSTVVGANLFKENTDNGVLGENALVLQPSDPLFVESGNRNFYPAPGSLAIDSSLNSLADRPNFLAVNGPLGIPPSPILAPDRDRFGQLRIDDPAQDPPPGFGSNIFKDRGAVERADFRGPTARLIDPQDNDGLGLDLNPNRNEVLVEPPIISRIVIQLDDVGIGVDDLSVTSDMVRVHLDDELLVAGTDYVFAYNATNNSIILRSLKNNGPVSHAYEIELVNALDSGIQDLAGNALRANKSTGATSFLVVTGGSVSDSSLPDFTLSTTQVNALEDNEQELEIPITEIPDFASDLPPEPGLGEPEIVFATISVSNPELFEVAPSIDQQGTLTFHTAADQNGTAEVVVRLTEVGTSNPRQSEPQTVTITLEPVNDAPSFTAPATFTVLEDAGLVTATEFLADLLPGPETATDELDQTLTVETTALMPEAFEVQPSIDSEGTLTFQTRPDFNSSMAELLVTFTVFDDGPSDPPNVNQSELRTFTIDVEPVNDPPSFQFAQPGVTVSENEEELLGIPESVFPGVATDMVPGPPTATDELTQSLSFTLTSTRPELFSQQPSMDADGTLRFRTAPHRNGVSTVLVQLLDDGPSAPPPNQNASEIATLTISITAVNDPPEFMIPSSTTVDEDAGLINRQGFATGIRPGPVEAVDESSQSVSFRVEADDPSAFSQQPSISPNGNLSFQTAQNVNGEFLVLVTLVDDGASEPPPNQNESDEATFTIVVNPVNDPPIPNGFSATLPEDTQIDIDSQSVLEGDLPGPTEDEMVQSLRITQIERTSAHNGKIDAVVVDGEIVAFTYTPPRDFVGTDTFAYVVTDDGVPPRSATGTISITLTAVNDPPQFNKGPDITVDEDSGESVIENWATEILPGPPTAVDELDEQAVSFTLSAENPALFAVQPRVGPDGTLIFTPAVDANGSTLIMATAEDDGPNDPPNMAVSSAQTFQITIDPINDPPVFTPGANIEVLEDSGPFEEAWATDIAPAAGLLETPPRAIDEQDQSVTFLVEVGRPELFSEQPTIDSTGQLRFTPEQDANGTAVLTVRAVDDGPSDPPNENESEAVSITVTIIAVNDPPVAVNDSYATDENTVLSISAPGLLANDFDVDMPDDTIFAVAGEFESTFGAVVILEEDGAFTYDPTEVLAIQRMTTGQSIIDTFTYTIFDEEGASSEPATVSITVAGINDPPVAVDDEYSIGIGQTRLLDILANDSDIDSTIDPTSIQITSLPVFGSVTVNQTGVVGYQTGSGFRGQDTFAYRVSDESGNVSNEAFVTVNVSDPPIAVDDSAFTFKNDSVDIDVLANDSVPVGAIDPNSVQIVLTPSPSGTAEVLDGGVIRFTPAEDFSGQVEFSYVVSDNQGTTSNVADVSIRVQNSRWQNPLSPLDVNDDRFVTPIDALLIINYINSGAETFLPLADVTPPPYLDTNGDELVTPIDALLVINRINANAAGGGAEGEAAQEPMLSRDSRVPAGSEEFAMLMTPQQAFEIAAPIVARDVERALERTRVAAIEETLASSDDRWAGGVAESEAPDSTIFDDLVCSSEPRNHQESDGAIEGLFGDDFELLGPDRLL